MTRTATKTKTSTVTAVALGSVGFAVVAAAALAFNYNDMRRMTTPPATVATTQATRVSGTAAAQPTPSRAPSYCKGEVDTVNGTRELKFAGPHTFRGSDVVLRVRNDGTARSEAFEIRMLENLTDGTFREQTRTFSALSAGAEREFSWGYTGQVRAIQFTLDSRDQVEETNECNNITSANLELI